MAARRDRQEADDARREEAARVLGRAYRAGFVNGTRNNSFTSIAGHLIGCGVDPQLAWYSIRCINLCAPEPEDEAVLEGIFHRVTDREIRKRGL